MKDYFLFPLRRVPESITVRDNAYNNVFTVLNIGFLSEDFIGSAISAINGKPIFLSSSIPEFYVEEDIIFTRYRKGSEVLERRLFLMRGHGYLTGLCKLDNIEALEYQYEFLKKCCEQLNKNFRYSRITGRFMNLER